MRWYEGAKVMHRRTFFEKANLLCAVSDFFIQNSRNDAPNAVEEVRRIDDKQQFHGWVVVVQGFEDG